MRWNKNVNKISFPHNMQYKNCPLSSFSSTNSAVLLLICNLYMSWSTRLVSLKLCVGFPIFDSVSFLPKLIFLLNKMHELFKFNRRATHSFAPRPLIFMLLQEVLKFIDICVSWSSPKTDLVTNFLNLEKQSFENVSFS